MNDLENQIQKLIKGEVDSSRESRQLYSHDASMFELEPQLIVYPKDSQDVQKVVSFVANNKSQNPGLSITARSGGTDMSGAAINESIILDFSRHFNKVESITTSSARTQPGVFYRDFDPLTLAKGSFLPSYPASRGLCTVGGMVNNNSGGEKSLRYGKTENFVEELKVVFSDGNEYVTKPLNRHELKKKMAQKNFEGRLYKKLFDLHEEHYDAIKAARPHVTKDSTGYHMWNVWDRETGIFDINRLIVGGQGTLGMVTDIKFKLVPHTPHSGILVCFMKEIDKLGEIINVVLTHKPESFESFDDNTLWLAIKFFFSFRRTLGWKGLIKLGWGLLPDGLMLLKGIPRLILLIEFTGQTEQEVAEKIHNMRLTLKPYKMPMEEDATEAKSAKFWIMRRESFNLLRSKVKDKHTAPFIDDLVVPPQHLTKFLPKIRKVIKKYKLFATIAGHMGDGNFHIIPLMNIEDPKEKAKLEPAMKEVNKLVLEYEGSLSGEHNDGMIRGPWLEAMYGPKFVGYFREVKRAFDPENIFNPHKKTDAKWDFSMAHLRDKF